MIANFENMPDSSRVWIYQSDKELNESEVLSLQEGLSNFLSQWESHGHPLLAAAKILNNRFLILAVDESVHAASGCSIDSSVGFLKSMEKNIGANFFDRSLIPFKIGGEITLFKLAQIKEQIKNHVINENTILLNTSLSDLAGFKSSWEQPVANSWIYRYF